MHPKYVALHEVTLHVNWCMVVWCIQKVRRDVSNFTWHQTCNNQNDSVAYVHHLDGYSKMRYKKANHSFRIAHDKSAMSLLESGEYNIIIYNNK